MMARLDASIVNVALPTLSRAFGSSIAAVEWVALAYLLTLTSLVVMLGRLADMVGRSAMYTAGFLVFIVGSALSGAAPTLAFLIGARILQAVGAAMLQANSVAIITSSVPARDRAKAIGYQGAAQAIGLSIGPSVGGFLISALGWRSIFYVNVPVGLAGTVLGLLTLPRDGEPRMQPFDYTGSALLTLALSLVVLGINQGGELGWDNPLVLGSLAGGTLLLAVFGAHERRTPFPVVDPALFRRAAITIGNITGMMSYAVMDGTLFLMPFFLEEVLHKSPGITGLLVTPVAVGMTVMAPVSGGLARRISTRVLTTAGMVLGTVGDLLLAAADRHTSFLLILLELLLVGVGIGVFTPPNNSAVMGAAPPDKLGVAGGILNMARSLGMSLGVAVAGAVLSGVLHAVAGTEHPHSVGLLVLAFRVSFLVLAAIGVAAAWLSWLRARPGTRASQASA